MTYSQRPRRSASSAQLPTVASKARLRDGVRGSAASEDFLLPLAVGAGVELAAGDPSVRRILLRHRCRLKLLEQPEPSPPHNPLSVTVLRRHLVRVSGAEAASVRRCCRQLAANCPAFAHRTPIRGGGGGDGAAATARSGALADARLSLLCRRRCQTCRPFQPGQLLQSHPVLKSILRPGNGSYSLKLVPATSSPNGASAAPATGRSFAMDDNYSIYFTDTDTTRSAQRAAEASLLSAAAAAASGSSNGRLFEGQSCDSCSITCTTVTISIGDPRGAACCADKAVGPDELCGRHCSVTEGRRVKCNSRSSSNSSMRGRRRCHRVTDRCVQTSPPLVTSAEKQVVMKAKVLDCYEVASAAAKPGCHRAPKLVKKVNSIAVAVASSELARCSKQRPLLLSNQRATGVPRSDQSRRLQGWVAHRRVTWYLRPAPRKSK